MTTTPIRQAESPQKRQATRARQKKGRTTEIALRGPTGPRTLRGKKRSRYNAIKHGIFSETVLKERESKAEYRSMLNSLVEYFQPEGALEALLVEKLAMLLWRHRRLVKAECAEIAKETEFMEEDTEDRRLLAVDEKEEWGELGSGMLRERENEYVFERAIELLQELREAVEARGFNIERDGKILRKLYGTPSGGELPRGLCRLYVVYATMAEERSEDEEGKPKCSPEILKESVLEMIDREIKRARKLRKMVAETESQRMRYTVAASLIPAPEVLDRLLRYEASLDRAFDRTLSQLERLQRMRLGHAVPPPVKVELSR